MVHASDVDEVERRQENQDSYVSEYFHDIKSQASSAWYNYFYPLLNDFGLVVLLQDETYNKKGINENDGIFLHSIYSSKW